MNSVKKILAVAAAAVLLLSSTACELGMRETYDLSEEDSLSMKDDVPSLNVAERVNSLDGTSPGVEEDLLQSSDPVTDEPEVVGEVSLVIAGDIKLSEAMIADAKAQAPEGKDYSFLRMYTGIYRTINDADIALGAYSAIGQPYGASSEYEPPAEHLDALASLGFDLLDISGAGSDYSQLEEREIGGISSAEEGDEAFRSIEKNGMTFIFAAVGGDGCAQSYNDDKFYENLEFADLPADVLIVSVHWEDGISAEDMASVAARLASGGADVIVGYGDSLGGTEWIDNGDGTSALVCYSLGNLISDAAEGYGLCSGVLSLTFTATVDSDGGAVETKAVVIPAVVHYTAGNSNFGIYRLSDYTDELAQAHSARVDVQGLTDYVKGKISEDFLPEELR